MVIDENSVSLLFSSSKSGHIRQSFSSLSLQLHAIYFSYVVGCLIILLKIKAFKFQNNVTLKWNICLKELKTFLFFCTNDFADLRGVTNHFQELCYLWWHVYNF